jgi:hypothetical protein
MAAALAPEKDVMFTVKFVAGVPVKEVGICSVRFEVKAAGAAGKRTELVKITLLTLPPTSEENVKKT